MLKIKIIFLFIILIKIIPSTAKEISSKLNYVTIETPHFSVLFDEKQNSLGQIVSHKLEQVYEKVSPLFKQHPTKTVVIINDKTDIANGYATRIPYPHIMIYPVLPGISDSIADYDDWIFELLVHEYTHILTFEGVRGFMRYLRPVFGSIISGNALMPRWWKEGVAVETETQLSMGGRLRSNYQDSVLRSLVLEDVLKSQKIYEINEYLSSWPEGQRPYLFGSLVWHQMVHEKGTSIITDLHYRQSGRVPFFINGPAEDFLGSDYEKFFEDTLYAIEDLVLKQIDVIKQVPETTTHRLQLNTRYSHSPQVSPDGEHLAFISIAKDETKKIEILNKNSKGNFLPTEQALFNDTNTVDDIYKQDDDENDAPPGGSIQKVSWFKSGKKILYDKVDQINSVESFSDLYVYDIKEKSTERLTYGARARESSLSPDNERIVFVQLSAFQTSLGIFDLNQKKTTIVYTPSLQERISNPIFIDNNTIIFSLRKSQREEGLWRFSLSDRKIHPLLKDYPFIRYAQHTSEALLFTSLKNGIRNIYSYNYKTQKVRLLTHCYSAFFSFGLDPKTHDLYVTKMTSSGPQVHLIYASDYEKTPENVPSVGSLLAGRFPLATHQESTKPQLASQLASQIASQKADNDFSVQEYTPWGYLWPHYWIPFLSTTNDGRTILQAQTGGFDPLKHHNYDVVLTYDSFTEKTSVVGSYLNQSYSTSFGGLYQQNTIYFANASNRATYTTKSLFLLPDIWTLNRYSSFQISAKDVVAQTALSTYLRQGLSLLYTFKNFTQPNSLSSPATGKSFYLGVNQFFASDTHIEQTQYLLGVNYYASEFLPDDHALAVKIDALYSPQKISPVLGASTYSVNLIQDSSLPYYLMRGYASGSFLGETMINPKTEYRFLMREINRGHSTLPLFLRRLHGAVTLDGLFLEGRAYRSTEKIFESVSTNRSVWSAGLELRFDLNLAYELPVTAIIGVYNPLSGAYGGNSSVVSNFQFSSIF